MPRRALSLALATALAAAPGGCRASVIDVAGEALLRAAAQGAAERSESPPAALPSSREIKEDGTGLAWTDLREGDGPRPRTGDLVVAHIRGMLEDGRVFEDTRAAGQPLVFTAGVQPRGVCDGLERGMLSMRAGGRRLLVVPPALGFGAAGAPGSLRRVPANAALRYEVELLRCGPAGDAGVACCAQPEYPCDAPAGFGFVPTAADAEASPLANPPSVNELAGLE